MSSNPENLRAQPQSYIKDGIEGTYGRYYFPDELVRECLEDKAFYEGKITSPSDWNISDANLIEQLPGGIILTS